MYTYIRCHPDEDGAVESFREIIQECDPNVPCLRFESTTLLMRVAMDGNDNVADILLQHPHIKINHAIKTGTGTVSKYEGWTALQFACEQNKRSIIDKLVAAGAEQTMPQNDNVSHRDYAAAACVTAVIKEKCFVLLVRKGDLFQEPYQDYLFPGGLYDVADQDFQVTAAREVFEETGVCVDNAVVSELLAFSEYDSGSHVRRGFYHFNLGEVLKLPPCVHRDDIASAKWVAIGDMQKTLVDDQIIYRVGDVPLRFDNSIMLHATLAHCDVDKMIISENQQLLYRLDEIGEFLVLGLRFIMADNHLKMDQQHLFNIVERMSAGAVKNAMEEFMCHINDVAQSPLARYDLLWIIRYLTKSARCHVDQLRWINPSAGKSRVVITLLQAACQCGDDELVVELLELGASPNSITTNSSKLLITPLMLVIQHEKCKLAELMIEKFNAHISTRSPRTSPLAWYCRSEKISIEFIDYLLNKMPLVNDADIGAAMLALIRGGQLEVLRLLHARHPVSLNKVYCDLEEIQHQFPLVCAIQQRCLDMVNLVVELGADPQMYIGNDTDYRKVVYATKMQVQSEIHEAVDNEIICDMLKCQLFEMHRIKQVIDQLTPECKSIDPDDVRKFIQKIF